MYRIQPYIGAKATQYVATGRDRTRFPSALSFAGSLPGNHRSALKAHLDLIADVESQLRILSLWSVTCSRIGATEKTPSARVNGNKNPARSARPIFPLSNERQRSISSNRNI